MNTEQPLGWTTIEQSRQLLEVGLDPETSDMFYLGLGGITDYVEEPTVGKYKIFPDRVDLPCWSLGKLLDLMPKGIETKKPKNLYFLNIFPASNGVGYATNNKYGDFVFLEIFKGSQYTTTLIEHVVSMVCWLLEKGYIKKGAQLWAIIVYTIMMTKVRCENALSLQKMAIASIALVIILLMGISLRQKRQKRKF